MSEPRRYVSPKREAQAAATRSAILDAFVEQLSDPGRNTLSPSEAAVRAGVSVRTVHLYFPNLESQVAALSEWFDQHLNPGGITPAAGPDDLPRYFREIHANALASPLSRALATSSGEVWQTVRRSRRSKRLEAIRAAVEAVGASARATAEATAMVLRLSGADASWPLHDSYGLSLDRIPDVIAHTVELIIRDLRTHVTDDRPADPRTREKDPDTGLSGSGMARSRK